MIVTANRIWSPLAALLLPLMVSCAPTGPVTVQPAPAHYDAVVDARFTGGDGDRVGGEATYRTIARALDAAPESSPTTFVIFIRNGRYHEKLSVDKANITLRGESRDGVVLTFDAHADTPRPDGGTFGTRGSFTLRVAAPGFHAERLTIENAFDYRGNATKSATDPTKSRNPQAVALLLDRGSDRARITDCVISGWQDTLFADAGRAWFHGCIILGQVDFIFGAGTVVFDDCDVVSRGAGYITAPSTPPLQLYGFVFLESRLGRETDRVKANTVALGRPWHPSSNPNVNPSAVFIDCNLDDHILVEGWAPMGGNAPETARFFEYRDHGVGAVSSPSRRLLNDAESARYAVREVLGGWTP